MECVDGQDSQDSDQSAKFEEDFTKPDEENTKTDEAMDVEMLAHMNSIQLKDVQAVLTHFSKQTYSAKDTSNTVSSEAMQRCIELFKLDYNVVLISNEGGELSAHYPYWLVVSEYELTENNPPVSNPSTTNKALQHKTIYENLIDPFKLKDLMIKARTARCRTRLPVPVILYRGKFICRSGTLSGGPEIYGRTGYEFLFTNDAQEQPHADADSFTSTDWQLFGKVRACDIKLLTALNVGIIVDFMVEKKKVKFGLNVTSSEKVDKENRYSKFKLVSLPYPGCEFFKDYRDNDYEAEGLVFDWSPAYVDASISVPEDETTKTLAIDWSQYKTWDLATITKNYLKLLLRYLQDSNSGLLIHCISGWDRTPLFISLIRLSLWADGLIHHNLDAQQILYLTITYDWMLFGHHFADRLSKGEEIFFFCFHILKQLTSEEYSVQGPGRFKTKVERPAERPVNRTDSDSHLCEGIMLEKEITGSNISLNSSGSSVSNKSQEFPPMFWHQQPGDDNMYYNTTSFNGNAVTNLNESPQQSQQQQPSTSSTARSPQSRRTSPVTVPASMFRQRHESSSSISLGSWQVITGAGSVRESETDSNGINTNFSENGSDTTQNTQEEEPGVYHVDGYKYRRRRLLKVRELFLTAYRSVIGYQMRNGGDSSFGTLVANIAEKVGLATTRPDPARTTSK